MRTGTTRAAALRAARLNNGRTDNRTERQIQTGSSRMSCGRRADLSIAFATVAMAGVLGGAGPSANAAPSDQVTIGLVTKTEVNPYFVKLRQAATAEAEQQDAKLIARFGKFDGDNEGQGAAAEALISAGGNGILITPNNTTRRRAVLKQRARKDIIVLAP